MYLGNARIHFVRAGKNLGWSAELVNSLRGYHNHQLLTKLIFIIIISISIFNYKIEISKNSNGKILFHTMPHVIYYTYKFYAHHLDNITIIVIDFNTIQYYLHHLTYKPGWSLGSRRGFQWAFRYSVLAS